MPTPHHSSDQQVPLTGVRTSGGELAAGAQPQMAIFSTDLQGEFRACNAAFTALVGYSPHELLGRDLSTIFASTEKINGDRSLVRRTILSITSMQGDYQGRLYAQPKIGASIPVQVSATLLRDSASDPMAVIAVVVPMAKIN